MRMLKVIVGLIGVGFTVCAWLISHHGRFPFVERLLAPEYSTAMTALNRMHQKGKVVLKSGEVGFTEISVEMILILGFQILWGATYEAISLLIALYMTGLAMGSYTAWKLKRPKLRMASFAGVQGLISLMTLLCIAGLYIGQKLADNYHETIPLIFTGLIFIAGYLGGIQFILANMQFAALQHKSAQKAGQIYAADLLGSSGGAFLSAVILVPLLGIIRRAIGRISK